MKSKFEKILAEIESGEISESTIRGLGKAFTANYRRANGWSVGVTASKLTLDELAGIHYCIEEHKPRVAKEQSERGYKRLFNLAYSPKRGNPRKSNPFSMRELTVLHAFSHFELVAFRRVKGLSLPVYRVVDKAGRYFEYTSCSWQSGGPRIEIL